VKLYGMRPRPAEDFSSSGRDFDRSLTPQGRERVKLVAARLAELDEVPKVIVSSPLVRALQTAEIVAAELGIPAVETRRALAPGGPAHDLVLELAHEGRKRLMVVGHEPDLSGLVESLLRGAFEHDMLKAMVVGLSVSTTGPATLRFVLDPKTLEVLRAPDAQGR
jgi:phosphohistidine phosphatase